jgi:hypothetical protein
MFAKTATTGQICNLILRFSHTAEYMSVQPDIANTQAQRDWEAVKKIGPSNKDLRRLRKRNVAGVKTVENILKEIQVWEKIDKENAAKKQFHPRKSSQRAVVVTPVRPPVRFPLDETPTVRLLRSTTSTMPCPNYYVPPLAEVIDDDSDAESYTTDFSADFSEDGYLHHTTSHPGPNVTTTPVTLLTKRLRSRKS